MNRSEIQSPKAPAPVGPYSQAIEVNGFVFCSGQISLDAESGELIKGSIQDQTKKVMENIGAVLAAAQLDHSHIVKATIFLKSMGDFALVNEVYGSYFQTRPPARSCVEVSELPKGVDVEIEVIAAR